MNKHIIADDNALIPFIGRQYKEILEILMTQPLLLNGTDADKKTLIHIILNNASLNDNEKYNIIKLCINKGANFDSPDKKGERPLHIASKEQQYEIVKLLLDNNADPNSITTDNLSPLHYAISSKHIVCKYDKIKENINVKQMDTNMLNDFKRFMRNYMYHIYENLFKIRYKSYTMQTYNDIKDTMTYTFGGNIIAGVDFVNMFNELRHTAQRKIYNIINNQTTHYRQLKQFLNKITYIQPHIYKHIQNPIHHVYVILTTMNIVQHDDVDNTIVSILDSIENSIKGVIDNEQFINTDNNILYIADEVLYLMDNIINNVYALVPHNQQQILRKLYNDYKDNIKSLQKEYDNYIKYTYVAKIINTQIDPGDYVYSLMNINENEFLYTVYQFDIIQTIRDKYMLLLIDMYIYYIKLYALDQVEDAKKKIYNIYLNKAIEKILLHATTRDITKPIPVEYDDMNYWIEHPDKKTTKLENLSGDNILETLIKGLNNSNKESSNYFKPLKNESNNLYVDDMNITHKHPTKCYQYDQRVIDILIKYGADVNAYYLLDIALRTENIDIINQLLSAGTKVNTKYKNLYNNFFEHFLSSFEMAPINVIESTNKDIKKELVEKTDKEHIFDNSDTILHMTSYLFMHQLSIYISSYPNFWSIENHNYVLNMINLTKLSDSVLPLDNIINDIYGASTETTILTKLQTKIFKYQNILLQLDNSIRNLTIEYSDTTDTKQQKVLEALKKECTEEKTKYEYKNDEIHDKINKIKTDNMANKNKRLHDYKSLKTQDYNTSHHVWEIYTNPFNIINDSTAYINCWRTLIKQNKKDNTQIYTKLSEIILKNNILDPITCINKYGPISELYDKVLSKYSRDMMELYDYFTDETDNYVLYQMYHIMEHVFKHIISNNFINIVSLYLVDANNGINEDNVIIYKQNIMNDFNTYCVGDMPGEIINSICKIKEGEQKTIKEILEEAIDRINIDDKELLKDTIVTYFVHYIDLYVKNMYNLMVGQCKSIIQQNKYLKILILLAQKVMHEIK